MSVLLLTNIVPNISAVNFCKYNVTANDYEAYSKNRNANANNFSPSLFFNNPLVHNEEQKCSNRNKFYNDKDGSPTNW